MEKENGGAAFARAAHVSGYSGAEKNTAQEGMTLRDYFAAKALQGLLAAPNHLAGASRIAGERPVAPVIAEMSYNFADAMLAERTK